MKEERQPAAMKIAGVKGMNDILWL